MSATPQISVEQERQAFDPRQLDTGRTVEVLEGLRAENEQLRTALMTRIVIEQAKGMLAERFDVGVDEAFEVLRREARSRRAKLHTLAAAVVAREPWTEPIFRAGEPRTAGARSSARRGVARAGDDSNLETFAPRRSSSTDQ